VSNACYYFRKFYSCSDDMCPGNVIACKKKYNLRTFMKRRNDMELSLMYQQCGKLLNWVIYLF